MGKSHTYDGVTVDPAPPKIESIFNSHYGTGLLGVLSLTHWALPARLLVPSSSGRGSEQGERAPPEDSSLVSEGAQHSPQGRLSLLFPSEALL